MAFVAGHLAVLVALTVVALAFGRSTFPTLATCSSLERWAVNATLGLGVLGQAALLLGLVGLLRRVPLALLALIALAGWWRVARFDARPSRDRFGRRRAVVLAGLIVAALLPLFLATLYPPTAFDETLYHLPTARAFAASGRLPFLADLRVPVFPQLGDLLMAVVLAWSDDVATHLVAFLATLLTALLLVAWGRALGRPRAGVAGAALFLGHPAVAYLAGTGYIDPELTLFATGAMFAADRWRSVRQPTWLVAAAFLAGCAACAKYFGLLFVSGVIVWAFAHAGRGRRAGTVALALLVVAATMAPTYGRIVYWTGNPVFPFLPAVFGSDPWTSPEATATGPWDRLRPALTLPWDLVFRREVAGGHPPYSPVYLLGLPLFVFGAWRSAWVRGALVACAVYVLAVPANARYVTAAAPLAALALAVSGALVVEGLGPHAPTARRLAAALCVAAFLPGWLYAGYMLRRGGPLPTTPRAREAYLLARLPVYAALRFLDESRREHDVAYQLGAEQMQYYARGRLLGDHNTPVRYSVLLARATDAEGAIRTLREWGVDWLLVTREARPLLPGDPGDWPGVRRAYADANAEVFELTGDGPRPPPRAGPRSAG
jgi:hypothetical protein